MSLLRKLTTRPVWEWEKRRPYPIRERWRDLPAIPARGGHLCVVLTTPATFSDALWTAWSWLRFLAPLVRLEIVVDGEITAAQREALAQISPGAVLTGGAEIVAATRGFPSAIRDFVEHHAIGRKLGLLLLRQQQGVVLFSDADVLAFHEPRELIAALGSPGATRYMAEPHGGSYDPYLLEAARARGLSPLSGLNAGLLLLPRDCLDLENIEALLAARPAGYSYFTEQTLLAVLLPPEAVALPRERYVVSTARQFYWETDVDYEAIAARHFTGPTRHVMYLKGLPRLACEARNFNPRRTR